MNIPDYFQKELKLIHPDFFAVYNYCTNRYEIRCWDESHNAWDIKDHEACSRKSWLRLGVSVRDEDDRDIGFKPLDQRVLFALKKSEKESQDPERMLREVDEANEANEAKIDRNIDQHFRDMANDIWMFCREIKVDYGARDARSLKDTE